jgi:nucleotide-binding universal stress UspA family protein
MLSIRNILLATDFSEGAECALDRALSWARRFEARLHLLHVVTAPERLPMGMDLVLSDYKEEAFGDLKSQAVSNFDKLLETRRTDDVGIETSIRRGEAAAPVVLAYAEKHDADLIATGSHGQRGARRLVLGSTSEEVAREAACPVLVARTCEHVLANDSPARVLVPVDFSDHSAQAVSYGRELAAAHDAELDLAHVVEQTSLPGVYGLEAETAEVEPGDVHAETRQALRELLDAPGPDVPTTTHVLDGHAADALAAFAEERETGLIVTASHGRTGLEHLAMGSVAKRIMRRAPCPVFIAKSLGKSLVA